MVVGICPSSIDDGLSLGFVAVVTVANKQPKSCVIVSAMVHTDIGGEAQG